MTLVTEQLVRQYSETGLTVGGDLEVVGTGPHAIGGGTNDFVQVSIGGSFTGGGGSVTVKAVDIRSDIIAVAGDTGHHTLLAAGSSGGASITTQGESETISVVSTMFLSEPDITVGTGDTVTNAATLYIQNAPDEGTNNFALLVDAGASRFDGNIGFDRDWET